MLVEARSLISCGMEPQPITMEDVEVCRIISGSKGTYMATHDTDIIIYANPGGDLFGYLYCFLLVIRSFTK